MGEITAMPIATFKGWIKSGKTKRPIAYVEPKGIAHPKPSAKPEAPAVIDPAAPYGKVGIAPFSSQVVGLKDNGDGTATVMRGEEPFYDFENGDTITVPTDATAGRIRQAVTDAGALSSRDKWFGVAKVGTKPAEAGTEPTKSEKQPATHADYTAPKSVEEARLRWKNFKGPEPERGQGHIALMDAVRKALDTKLFYNRDVDNFVAKELGVTAEQRKAGTSEDPNATGPMDRVDGGAFGYDVYLAREVVESEKAKQAEIAAGERLKLIVGMNVGQVKLNDGKMAAAATVESLTPTGVVLTAKRGPQNIRITTGYVGLEIMAQRAGNEFFKKRATADSSNAKPVAAIAGKPVVAMPAEQLQKIASGESKTFGKAAVDKAAAELQRREIVNASDGSIRPLAGAASSGPDATFPATTINAGAEAADAGESTQTIAQPTAKDNATKEAWQYGELEFGDKYIDETVLPDLRKQLANAHGGKFQEYPSKAAAVRGLKERIDTLENHRDAKARKYYASLDNHYGAVRAALADGKPVPPVAYESYEDLKGDVSAGRIKGDGQEVARVEQPQHIEAGQAEPATAPVIAASIKESAKNTPMNVEQAREWLLSEIDKAIIDAKSAKEEGIWNRADDKVNLEGIMDVGATIGFKTFNVPGDGKFRVLNLKESLQKFKKQVAATPGFKKNATRPMSVANGSGGKTSVRDMLDEGEYVLAADYGHLTGKPLLFGAVRKGEAHPIAYTDAEPVDIKGIEAQVGREWNVTGKSLSWRVIETTTGASVSSESTKEKAISKALAHVDEHGTDKLIAQIKETPKVSQAELERQFTDWGSEEEAKAQKTRDAVERADAEDRALWNSIWPLDDGEKRSPNPWNDIDHMQVVILAKDAAKAGKGDEFVSLIERRRGGTNNVLALAARKALAEGSKPSKQSGGVDYKGFERTPTGNGNFTLKDGNLLVKVEAMGGGKFQASHASAKSSPHINSEQGAVDWAANLRDSGKKTTAYPFYSDNKLFNAEGTAELPKDWTGVARSDSGKRFFYLGWENGERSYNPLQAKAYDEAVKEAADKFQAQEITPPEGYKKVSESYFGGSTPKPVYAPFAVGDRVRSKQAGYTGAVDSLIGGPVTTGAIIQWDNGSRENSKWKEVEAEGGIHSVAMFRNVSEFDAWLKENGAGNIKDGDGYIEITPSTATHGVVSGRETSNKKPAVQKTLFRLKDGSVVYWEYSDRVGDGRAIKVGLADKRVHMNEAAPPESIAGKPVTEMSDGTLNQIAASSQPAATKAKNEVTRRAKVKAAPLEEVGAGDTASKGNTEDAGDELTYNRRNRITRGLKWEDVADKNVALRVKEVTKAKVFPKPDYQALVDDGTNPLVVHLVKQVYDAIATVPSMGRRQVATDADMKLYIDALNRVMDGVQSWATDRAAVAKWASRQANGAAAAMGKPASLSDLESVQTLLDTVYPGGWKNYRQEVILLGGNKLLGALQPGYDEVQRATKDIAKGWPGKRESWQQQGYRVLQADDEVVRVKPTSVNGGYFIEVAGKYQTRFPDKASADQAASDLDPWLLLDKRGQIVSGHPSEAAATEAARVAVERKSKAGQIHEKGRSVESAERIGPARRMEGEDISSDRLKDDFGFRGINFGEWMKGESPSKVSERQLHLNHAYDAFLDLAEILNVPPKAMSLNGMLGLAIGAQGGGKALAHFVPGVNEINLTRTGGAGALAHEWGHALDHYFGTLAGLEREKRPYLTEHASVTRREAVVVDGRTKLQEVQLKAELRPEILERFKAIVAAMSKRAETATEAKQRLETNAKRYADHVESWLRYIRKEFSSATKPGTADMEAVRAAALVTFDNLAARIGNLDLGEGMVAISRDSAITPVVAEMRDAFKSAFGRFPDIESIKALQANIDGLRVVRDRLAADVVHEPQQIATDYQKASNAADEGKKKPYWGSKVEMFARAFDAFVVDALAENAAKNSYLAGIEAVPPMGEERKAIDAAFRDLVAEIKTKETDSGVAMFNAKSGSWDNPLDAAALEATIARVIAGSPSHFSRDTVVTASLFADLPAPILAKAKKEGYDANGRKPNGEKLTGATYDGKVYLVQENISSELEAEETLLHERIHQIVHGNAKDPDGIALRQSLGKLYTRAGAKSGIERMAKEAGIDMAGPLAAFEKVAAVNRHAFLAEEFLAHAEGQRAYEKLPAKIKRAAHEFWGEFRDWLRSSKFVRIAEALGAKLDDFTQADLAWTLKGIRQQEAGTGSKAIRFMTAWHGSPHDHDGFDSSKIGTGEGAQAYGWGHYFASAREVAEHYRRSIRNNHEGLTEIGVKAGLSQPGARALADAYQQNMKFEDFERIANTPSPIPAIEAFRQDLRDTMDAAYNAYSEFKKPGKLYQVELAPTEDELLDWDKPLSEQSEKVKAALGKVIERLRGMDEGSHQWKMSYRMVASPEMIEGRQAYKLLAALNDDKDSIDPNGDKAASEYLHSIGIRGIKYLDGSSRNRPLKEIKAEFLAELPEDADTAEVMELVGTGRFSPKNEALIKALADDDWLGFDYPAQAISAALGNSLSNYDASPALLQAVSDAKNGGTHNYVIFDDADVKITAKESRASAATESQSVKSIKSVVDQFKREFKGAAALDIRVVQSRMDIPAAFRPSPFAEGVFHDDAGLIYLVAMNLKHANGQVNTGRVWQVLLHECVGHFGLAKMMGSRFGGILKEVMRAARAKSAVGEDIYEPGHPDYATVEAVRLRYPEASDEEIAQEVLARMEG